MDHYVDIHILPDPEFTPPILLGALYSKLHKALVELKADDIGVSFPKGSKKSIGNLLRLHGQQHRLAELMGMAWLQGMHDHIRVNAIAAIPDTVEACLVKRRQYQTNVERLRRRRMRRKGESFEEVLRHIPEDRSQQPELPFIHLRSQSTGHKFPLFIEQSLQPSPSQGLFNTYGLSSTGTIPWF